MMGLVKHTIEKGSGAFIYIQSFIKTGSGIQKLMGEVVTQTGSRSHRPTFKVD
jgi:hypothetical protein